MQSFLGQDIFSSSGPLNNRDTGEIEIFLKTKILHLRRVAQPIKVHVIHWDTTRIFMENSKRWTGDITVSWNADPFGDGLGKSRFTGSQITVKTDDISGTCRSTQGDTKFFGLFSAAQRKPFRLHNGSIFGRVQLHLRMFDSIKT